VIRVIVNETLQEYLVNQRKRYSYDAAAAGAAVNVPEGKLRTS
jgi:hypothetical protein